MSFPQITYPVVTWGLYAGIAAAAIASTASRFTTGNAIRTLIAEGATSPENAKTADELGLTGGSRRALAGSLYGKLFLCANESEAAKPPKRRKRKKPAAYEKKKLDMKKARFYLPKDKEDEALARFPRTSVISLVAALVLLTAAFTLLHFFLPSLVSAFTGAFTN